MSKFKSCVFCGQYGQLCLKLLVTAVALLGLTSQRALAQTDIMISGAQAGFPIAVAQLCNAGGAGDAAVKIPEVINRNLEVSGLFQVINAATFIETPGKCTGPDQIAYSDWSVIGAEAVIKGTVSQSSSSDSSIVVELLLHDVIRQKMVVGKRYEGRAEDIQRIAHRFSNEVVEFFTGTPGIFGTRIAYVSKVGRFKELFVMNLDGSDVTRLTRDRGLVVSPSWSPRGDRIIYTSYQTRRPELYLVSPEGSTPKQITDRPGMELGAVFTQDARSIYASATVAGVSNIVMFGLDGNLKTQLTKGASIDISPSPSPDESRIVFCSNRSGGPQIYVMQSDGSGARRISYTDSPYCTSPKWSPTGEDIAYVCRKNGNQLFISKVDGSQTLQLTFDGYNEDPSWSPDGKYLAFASTFGRNSNKNIAILSLANGQVRQLTFGKTEDSQPSWSPRLDY